MAAIRKVAGPHKDSKGTIVNVDLSKGRTRPQLKNKPNYQQGPGGQRPPAKKQSEKQRFIWAEGQQESGGNYNAVNESSGALGRWQVMPANLPSWLREAGLADESPEEFIQNHTAQNKVAWAILGGDYNRYGARGAASVWYSGQPNWHATYGDPPVYQYVADVIAIMNSGTKGTVAPAGPGGSVTTTAVPSPGADSWSAQVRKSGEHMNTVATRLQAHAKAINGLL
jgi:hypothetical protein